MTSFQEKVYPVRKSRKNSSGQQKSKFSNGVFKIVKQIPKGKTSTYSIIAQEIGSPRAWRAVGNVLNRNQNSKIPCHRVIKSDGKIGGYRYGTKRKTTLLKKEGVVIRNWRVVL